MSEIGQWRMLFGTWNVEQRSLFWEFWKVFGDFIIGYRKGKNGRRAEESRKLFY